MFTGIISNTTNVTYFSESENTLSISNVLNNTPLGTSISVDGVCLTVSDINEDIISFDISEETIEKSIINSYTNDSVVNLELPTTPSSFLSGHIVLGHIDSIGELSDIENIKPGLWNYYFSINNNKFIVDKGSVAINGISLTTNVVDPDHFYVSIIKETYDKTNLSNLDTKKNIMVNIEYDIIGKYVYKFTK